MTHTIKSSAAATSAWTSQPKSAISSLHSDGELRPHAQSRTRPSPPLCNTRGHLEDCGAAVAGERIWFSSAIQPLCERSTWSLDALSPVLYLRGISIGDFQEALTAPLAKDALNLPVGAAIRVRVDRQRPPADPHGRPRRMHADAVRRNAGRQELIGFRSRAGNRGELARAADRRQSARVAQIAPQIAGRAR